MNLYLNPLFFFLKFTVFWKPDVARPSVLPFLNAFCIVGDVNDIPHDPIATEDISIISQSIVPHSENRYEAVVQFSFVFVYPKDRQPPTVFEVWFRESKAPPNVNVPNTLRIGVNRSEVFPSITINEEVAPLITINGSDTTNLYFQVHNNVCVCMYVCEYQFKGK